jgi:hypothetical protein
MSLHSGKPPLTSIRIILAAIIAASATVTAVSAQQTAALRASRAKLLVELRSDDSQVRIRAFDQLRSDPHYAIPRSRRHSSASWIGRVKSQSTPKRRALRLFAICIDPLEGRSESRGGTGPTRRAVRVDTFGRTHRSGSEATSAAAEQPKFAHHGRDVLFPLLAPVGNSALTVVVPVSVRRRPWTPAPRFP